MQAQQVYRSTASLAYYQAAHEFRTGSANTSVVKIRQDGRFGIRVGTYPDWDVKSRFNVGFGMGSFTADDLAPHASGGGACVGLNAALQSDGYFYLGATGGTTPLSGGTVLYSGADGSFGVATIPSSGTEQWVAAGSVMAAYRRLRVLPDGKVQIGRGPTTASPHFANYKLAVDGKLVAQSIHVVGPVDWADFVFAPGYRLMPLPELERYLQEHRHLPAIPSAQEVQAQGLDLAAMQAKLLQQVEELTLRVIELDKQNQQLRRDVQALAAPQH